MPIFAPMLSAKKYFVNPSTLSIEVQKRPKKWDIIRGVGLFLASIGAAVLYIWIYVGVFGFELPKTARLKMINEGWKEKVNAIDRNIKKYDAALTVLQIRDDDVYRNLFGMSPIPAEVRNAGFGGVNRYSYLDDADHSGQLRNAMMGLDIIAKKSYVQSKSYDEVEVMASKVNEMMSCIPNICPIMPTPGRYRMSSSYGNRTDPVTGRTAFHSGIDFAMNVGNSVYATADGVVSEVVFSRSGYGNCITIDHGFGYKTRYAHLSNIFVHEGLEVKRGDFIGKTGNTGRSTGPHLHYEVIYMGRHVNPYNYFNLDMPLDEYSSMIRHAQAENDFALHPSHVKK